MTTIDHPIPVNHVMATVQVQPQTVPAPRKAQYAIRLEPLRNL